MEYTFGVYLRSLIDKARMTQVELARRTGIHTVTINKILSGKFRNGYAPEADTIEKIAKAVPCSLNEHINLYRHAGKIPARIIELFVENESFAVELWEAWARRTADIKARRVK